MFDFIIFSIFIIFFGSLSISLIKTKIENKKLLEKLLESNIEKALLSAKLATELDKVSNDTSIDQEGFVNFLSKSRDWAFEYIENVQEELSSFKNIVGGILVNFKEGKVTDLNLAIQTISDSYDELISNLPEDEEA